MSVTDQPNSQISSYTPPEPRKGLSRVVKVLLIVGGAFGVITVVVCGGIIYVFSKSPDTRVLPGRQIPTRFVEQIDKLAVLEDGEQIQFFYSDAVTDIADGFYLVTDRAVIIYSNQFDEPTIRVPFEEIVDIEADFSDSWFMDSTITLSLADGSLASFPVSSEGGGDKQVYDALKKKLQLSGK